ncbi:MAG TPA: site-2 protease family protein [Pseudoflavonifractor sp.]|nr:site-2 protease family protein [Pseudoflavonifractor sp.]
MLRWKRVEVTGGFLLMTAALYYLDDQGLLLWAGLAAALHELGHLAAIYGLGGRVARLRLSAAGAEMVLSASRTLGPGAQFLAALSGPVTNLAFASLSAGLGTYLGEEAYLFAGLNLGLAAFNLLPMEQLDGGRLVYQLVALFSSPHTAARAVRAVSILTAAALLLGGAALLWTTRANFTLLVTAAWLAASLYRPKRRKSYRFCLQTRASCGIIL